MKKTSLILLFLCCNFPLNATAGWVEERWTDSKGVNHQGTISPPSNTHTPPPRGNENFTSPPVNTGPTKAEKERVIADALEKGSTLFKAGDYDAALAAYWDGFSPYCEENMNLDGCYDLEQGLLWARAKKDTEEQANKEKTAEAKRLEKEAAARAEREAARQRAMDQVNQTLQDMAVDFDGNGTVIDLKPMDITAPDIPGGKNLKDSAKSNNNNDTGHMDSGVVDLRFMDEEQTEAPKLLREGESTQKAGANGVKYNEVPPPAAYLPQKEKEKFAAAETVELIMRDIDHAGGDLETAMETAMDDLKNMGGGNQNGQEAYNYIAGLYTSEINGGETTNPRPFSPRTTDSAALMEMIGYLEPDPNESLEIDTEGRENLVQIKQSLQERDEWLQKTLEKYNGNIEKSLKKLRKRKEPGARNAYRFLQGYVAYQDMKDVSK